MQGFDFLYRTLFVVLSIARRITVLMAVLLSTVGVTYAVDIQIPDSGATRVQVTGIISNVVPSNSYNSDGTLSGGMQSATANAMPPGVHFVTANSSYPQATFNLDGNPTSVLTAFVPDLSCVLLNSGQYAATTKAVWMGNVSGSGMNYGHPSVTLNAGYSYNAGSMSVIANFIDLFVTKWSSGHKNVILSADSSKLLDVSVNSSAIPGGYAFTYRMSCSGNDNTANQAAYFDISYSVNLVARPTSCSITPPQTVDFGDIFKGSGISDTVISFRDTTLNASCDVANGSPDINRGMYLTFEPGSYGIYGGNVNKLATNNSSFYIMGGPAFACSVSRSSMAFDGTVNAEYKLKTLSAGVNDAQKLLSFTLCRDTSKPWQTGSLKSDAKVNLVIQ